MNMEDLFKDEIRKVIESYKEFYLYRTIRTKQKESGSGFSTFLEENDGSLSSKLKECARKEGKPIEEIVFEALDEKEKNRIGALFHNNPCNIGDMPQDQLDLSEKCVLNSKMIQDYKAVSLFLTEEQNKRFAYKLSDLLYSKLDEETRKSISKKHIRIYILNLGFIKISRVSHREAIEFVKEYKALFSDENEVLLNIMGRYLDEELVRAPINETDKKISELKVELSKLYNEVINGN
ncbi:hypothetical protein J4231_00865 [Candidatus Woesearchaeota archaeon]|nr:hypothetical protein [Candidatus Woesearchaeota archaeon]